MPIPANAPLLRTVTLTGGEGLVTWGYHTAAVCRGWTIRGKGRDWRLSATLQRADDFQLRQTCLYFHAPRKGGYWCWPIVAVTAGPTQLVATLGQPEQ